MRWTVSIAAACAALSMAAPAVAATSTFFGTGAGRECYLAAKAGASSSSALALCDVALEKEMMSDRDRAATFTNRGVIRLHRREAAQARADFSAALAMRPELGEAHVNLGAALIMAGDPAGGIAAIDKGLDLKTDQPHEAYFNRGIAREALGDTVGAYRDYSQAAALAPDWSLPKVELARFTVETRMKAAP
jgi:lipoprotein NlpI